MSKGKVYWDSDSFLGWLQDEADKVEACRGVLEEAAAGRLLIVTSALTLTEVLNLKGRAPIPAPQRNKVQAFFRRSYIAVVNLSRSLAENARDVVWDYGIKPKDAVHVVTAIEAKASQLHTFDKKLIAKTGLVGTPPLEICTPSVQQGTLDLVRKERGDGKGD